MGGYAITSIEQLTPGEEIFVVYPHMVVRGTKACYTDDGMKYSVKDTEWGTTVKSYFTNAKYVCRGFSDNVSPRFTGLNEEETFTYLPISKFTEIKTDQTCSYSAFNLIESPRVLTMPTNNFIVRAKDIEELNVDWTIPKPRPYWENNPFNVKGWEHDNGFTVIESY